MDLLANNLDLKSWVDIPQDSDFPIQNIPFGIIYNTELSPRVASRIGNYAIDLLELHDLGYLDDLAFNRSDFDSKNLNQLMRLGKLGTRKLRDRIAFLLSADCGELRDTEEKRKKVLLPIDRIENLLPVKIGDYTDFYSSIEHATNVGTMFRDPSNALLPNWKYIPVGYHGRASSIVLSGTPIHRPKGQQRPNENEAPVFGPCKLLDFELEMAFITYEGKPLGDSISTKEADDYIFGMVLFNDWSARDIQKWEYVPLGPFLAKNFGSSMSAWVVTLDALEHFRVAGPKQDPAVFPYLEFHGEKNIDIDLEVFIKPMHSEETRVCLSNYKYMYWNQNQQLAHHTINGCDIHAGDVYASGTISGPTPDSYGSMLEISWKGSKSIPMKDGTERKFIQDNDTVIMRGHCEKGELRIGFGEVETQILPAK